MRGGARDEIEEAGPPLVQPIRQDPTSEPGEESKLLATLELPTPEYLLRTVTYDERSS